MLYWPDCSLLIENGLKKIEFALTPKVWFTKTPNSKSKNSFARLNGVKDFYFAVDILPAYIFVCFTVHFNGLASTDHIFS